MHHVVGNHMRIHGHRSITVAIHIAVCSGQSDTKHVYRNHWTGTVELNIDTGLHYAPSCQLATCMDLTVEIRHSTITITDIIKLVTDCVHFT